MSDLLSIKELAAALGRSRTYVHAMKKSGFVMPGRTATLDEARAWLRANPWFSSTSYSHKRGDSDDAVRIDIKF